MQICDMNGKTDMIVSLLSFVFATFTSRSAVTLLCQEEEFILEIETRL